MASLNHCSFIGNLGKDPEVRAMQNGKKVASFSIACSETWKDKATGEKKERTEWIPCTAFDPLAGVIERYVKKGSKIHVSGPFQTRSWDDPQGGGKKYKSEIMVKDLIMLDAKREGSQGGGYQAGASAAQSAGSAPESGFGDDYGADAGGDDLPFDQGA